MTDRNQKSKYSDTEISLNSPVETGDGRRGTVILLLSNNYVEVRFDGKMTGIFSRSDVSLISE